MIKNNTIMKKLLLTLAVVLFTGGNAVRGQITVKAAPNETVELMTEIAALTQVRGLTPSHILPEYKRFVDSCFVKYEGHSVIKFMHDKLIMKGLMSMEMPTEIGVNSQIIAGNFVCCNSIKGWSEKTRNKFVKEVNKFYHDTDFHTFWEKARADFYPMIDSVFANVFIPALHIEWLNGYVPVEGARDYDITVSYLCGEYNFGPMLHGNPNPVIGFNPHVSDMIEKSRAIIFPKIEAQFAQQAYGQWRIVLYESLVRASVNTFLREDKFPAQLIADNMAEDKRVGIYWIKELTDLMCDYEAHRDQYPTLDSFMPRVVDFYNDLAAKAEK